MEIFTLKVAILLIIALLLTLVGIYSARHGTARLVMVLAFTIMTGMVFDSAANLLGRAKPVAFEWLQPQVEEATILSGHLMENQGIYLTLVWDGSEPYLYVLPWDKRTAEQLQEALSQAEQNGTHAMMRQPFEQLSQPSQQLFYAQPQPALPDKPEPAAGIRLG
jgi:hypothetical protein